MNSSGRRAPGSSTPRRRPAPSAAPAATRGHKPTAAASSAAVRRVPRPAWNGYLTDEAQYKLSRERQLVRQMQQLSAAHFHARASPARKQRAAAHDEDYGRSDARASSSAASSQSDDASLSPTPHGYQRHAPFGGHRRVADRSPERLSGELSALEHMLSKLELETELVASYEAQLAEDADGRADESLRGRAKRFASGEEHAVKGALSAVDEQGDDGPSDENEDDENSDDASFDDAVAQICYKSLRVGIDLTQKMHVLAQQLASERHRRKAHEKRIHQLEQLSLAAQRRSDEVDSRYHELASQVGAMRDAMIATEEALHRVSQELVRSREREASFATESHSRAHRQDHNDDDHSDGASFEQLEDHEVEAEIHEDGSLRSRPEWRAAHHGLRINSDLIMHH